MPDVRLTGTESDQRVLHIEGRHRQLEADHTVAARHRAQRVAHQSVRAELPAPPHVRQVALRDCHWVRNDVRRTNRQAHDHQRICPMLRVQCNRFLPGCRKQAIVPDQRQPSLTDSRIQLRYRRVGPHMKMECNDAITACHIGDYFRLCSSFHEMHAQRIVWQHILHNGVIQITVCVIFDRHIYQYHTITTRRIGYNRTGPSRLCKGLPIQIQRQIALTDLSIQYTISTCSYSKPQHFRRIAPMSCLVMPFVATRLPIYGIVPLIPVAGVLCNHYRTAMVDGQVQSHDTVAAVRHHAFKNMGGSLCGCRIIYSIPCKDIACNSAGIPYSWLTFAHNHSNTNRLRGTAVRSSYHGICGGSQRSNGNSCRCVTCVPLIAVRSGGS